jgi:hypothetical protein
VATQQDAIQTVYDHFEKVGKSGLNDGAKALALLHLAEAYAWLMNPAQAHGGSKGV